MNTVSEQKVMNSEEEKVIAHLGTFEDSLVTSENGEWTPQLHVSEDGVIQAYTTWKNGGMPGSIYHGLTTSFPLSDVRSDLLNIWVEENIELFQALLDSHETWWDGSNWKGSWDEDAEHDIEEALREAHQDMCYDWVCWEVTDILENDPETYVSTTTTDEEINAIADEQISDCSGPSAYIGPDVRGRVIEALKNARQEMIDDSE